MKVVACVLALLAVASGHSSYQFSDGYLDILGGEPNQSFDCTGRPYGYYADVANACRVFHICLPIPNAAGEVVEMAHYSFFCGNQTVFSQESLTCDHPQDAFPCEESEALYQISNGDFGKIPDYDYGAVDFGRRSLDETDVDLGRDLEEGEVGALEDTDSVGVAEASGSDSSSSSNNYLPY